MPQSSRNFRIFVSSTFGDLVGERNALQAHVFPRLRELAMAHGCRFQAIDLRWGVSEEAALDQQTMKICLGEIARCQKTSPRPNFIILLGDRYGWRPLPAEIPADEFERIHQCAPQAGKALLEQWYRRDANAVPAVYCLQPRSAEFIEYAAWEKVENQLRQVFQEALPQLPLSPQARLKYTASATEQEIFAGALQSENAPEHVFGYLRAITGMPAEECSLRFRNADPLADQLQTNLKDHLRSRLGGNVHEYRAAWEGSGPSQEHVAQLCEDVFNDLAQVILAEVKKLETVDALDKEVDAHKAFGEERARVLVGRDDLLQTLSQYLASPDAYPLVIRGEAGSGKSALMAKAVEQAQSRGMGVIYRFIGATPGSSNVPALLESLCRQISRFAGVAEADLPYSFRDLAKEFPKRLALATAEKPLILFLDALDQLTSAEGLPSLDWLPARLPKHVALVLSTLPNETLTALQGKLPAQNTLDLKPLSEADASSILGRWLEEVQRRLQPQQEQLLLERFQQCGLPLYLKLAFEEARLWKSYDPLPEFPENIPGMLETLFKRLSLEANHGERMVSRSLGYLAAAKNGLSEDELIDVLSLDGEVLADFQRRSPKSPRVERLPVVIWSRLYFDLEPYLKEFAADGTTLLTFYHPTTFGSAVRARYADPTSAQQRHASLAAYFKEQAPARGANAAQRFNVRSLSELPYQQASGGMLEEVRATLTDLAFIAAKTEIFKTWEVDEDFRRALALGDDAVLRILHAQFANMTHILNRCQTLNDIAGALHSRLHHLPELAQACREAQSRFPQPFIGGWITLADQPHPALVRTLIGHTSYVYACAVSPDERWIVSASHDQSLKVWDAASGQVRHTLSGHSDAVLACAFSPDGRWIVSAAGDHTLKVWELQTGVVKLTLQGHAAGVLGCAVSPDGGKIVSASADRTLKVWDAHNGSLLRTLSGHTAEVGGCAFSPDGRSILSASWDKTLKIWDAARGKERSGLYGHQGHVDGCAYSPDGRWIVSASADKTLKVWDAATGQARLTLAGHSGAVNGCAASPDGRWIVSAAEDTTLKVWDAASGQEMITLPGGKRGVNGCTYSPSGRWIVSGSVGSLGGMVRVWDAAACQATDRPLVPGEPGHADTVSGCAFSPDGSWLVTASLDQSLKVWDTSSGEERLTLRGHSEAVNGCAVSPDGSWIASASHDKTLRVWDAASGRERACLRGHIYSLTSCATSPDGRWIVSASADSTLMVWAAANRERFTLDRNLDWAEWLEEFKAWCALRFTLKGHQHWVRSCAWSPDGRWIVSASNDQLLKVWDAATGQERLTLKGHTGDVNHCEFSPDGRWILSSAWDNTLKTWDAATGAEHLSLPGHTYRLESCAFSPDGRWIVSVAEDAMLKVWDAATGACLATFYADWSLRCCAWSPDGEHLVAGGKSGIYWLRWVVADPDPIRQAERRRPAPGSADLPGAVAGKTDLQAGAAARPSADEAELLLAAYRARILEETRPAALQKMPAVGECRWRLAREAARVPAGRALWEYYYGCDQFGECPEDANPVDPCEALRQQRQMVVYGAPGQGKTLLQQMAQQAAQDPRACVPLFVALPGYAAALAADPGLSLAEYAVRAASAGDEPLRRALEQEVQNGRVLWLADDGDGAGDGAESLARQARQLPGRLVLSAQPLGDTGAGLEGLPAYEILPVSHQPARSAAFYRDWLEEMAASFCAGGRAEKGVVVKGFCHLGWSLHLAAFAAKPQPPLGREALANKLAAALALDAAAGCAELAQAILTNARESGVLCAWHLGGNEIPIFGDLGLQEYAAAWVLAQAWQQDARRAWDFLEARLHNRAWRGPIFFLAELLPDSHLLIQRILEADAPFEKQLQRNLRLAAAIAAANPEKAKQTARPIAQRIEKIILNPLAAGAVASELAAALAKMQPALALPMLQNAMRSKDKHVRQTAAAGLQAIGAQAIPSLLEAQKDPAWEVRACAVEALGALGDVQTLPALIESLQDGEYALHARAEAALLRLVDAQTAPDLLKMLQNHASFKEALPGWLPALAALAGEIPPEVARQKGLRDRTCAVEEHLRRLAPSSYPLWVGMKALGLVGQAAVPLLQDAVQCNQRVMAMAAAYALGQIGSEQAIGALAQAQWESDDWQLHANAIQALQRIGAPAAPVQCHLLRSSKQNIRREAARAIGFSGGQLSRSSLFEALKDPDPEVRAEAAQSLGKLADAPMLALFQEQISHPESSLRAGAALALGEAGATCAFPLKDSIPALIECLKDEDAAVRRAALQGLGKSHNPHGLPFLAAMLQDPEALVRLAAAEALQQIGGGAALALIAERAQDSDWSVVRATLEALGRAGDAHFLPVIQAASLHATLEVRIAAAKALGKIGGPTSTLALKDMLTSGNPSFVYQNGILPALGQIGDTTAIRLLLFLYKEYRDLRSGVLKNLRQVRSPQAAAGLVECLHHPSSEVRTAACEALETIRAAQAIPALQAALKDEEEVRQAAARALGATGAAVDGPAQARQVAELLSENQSEHLEAVANWLALLQSETLPEPDFSPGGKPRFWPFRRGG